MRDYWLANYEKFELWNYSYISSNYLSRNDANCSLRGMEGIARRWLVIEGDLGTLEQQFWIHKQLDAQYSNLGCLLYSGGKSFMDGISSKVGMRAMLRFVCRSDSVRD